MTGTLDHLPLPAESEEPVGGVDPDDQTPVVEQAKGVLIFRYSIDACTARRLLDVWGAESGAGTLAVAHVLVRDICQGDCGGHRDQWLSRWVEEKLRREPDLGVRVVEGTPAGAAVRVTVDLTEESLDAVVEAAHRAARTAATLELAPAAGGGAAARLARQLELAERLARAVEPTLTVTTSEHPEAAAPSTVPEQGTG